MAKLKQDVVFQCTCCQQTYRPNNALADRLEAALFGADPYAVCAICEQNVSDKLQTDNYKQRWRQAMLPSLDHRAIKVAMLAIYLRRGITNDEGFDTALKEAQQAYPAKTINQLKSMGDELSCWWTRSERNDPQAGAPRGSAVFAQSLPAAFRMRATFAA